MATKLNVNGFSSLASHSSLSAPLAASREKMISMLVEARLFQTAENGLQIRGLLPLPMREKDKAHAREVRTLLGEVFGAKGQLPFTVRKLVGSYFSNDDLGALSIYVNLPRHIDLTDARVVKGYLAPSVEDYASSFLPIAKGIYEVNPHTISQSKYGSAFPMNPEILAYAMQLGRGETVLEIAGANGENSALLAFSEAQQVYMNDIGQEEVANFEVIRTGLRHALPSIGKKLVPVCCNSFDLLKVKPELGNKVGLVLCRNLIHFFNDTQQAEFMALLKKTLKPGGHAIFTVNSVYFSEEMREVHLKKPDATSFLSTMGLIVDHTQGFKPIARFYFETDACSPDKVSTEFVARYIYKRKVDSAWEVDNGEFNKLDQELRSKIAKGLEPYKKGLKDVPVGAVKVLTSTNRGYSSKTLPALFASHGFEIEATFVTSYDGHLVHDENLFRAQQAPAPGRSLQTSPQLVSVIVRYSGT